MLFAKAGPKSSLWVDPRCWGNSQGTEKGAQGREEGQKGKWETTGVSPGTDPVVTRARSK